MKLECPNCGAENEIPKEDWPTDCSTTEEHICYVCENPIRYGVHCTIELR